MLLKLVNDISSIEATLRSNHTLQTLLLDGDIQILMHIDNSTSINSAEDILEAVGREKVIWTQLLSETRAQMAEILGVNHSLYSEIDPLHLPEVLSMVGLRIGQGELYLALKSSIAGVISTVNEKQCIRQQMAYHAAKLEELGTKLAAIEAAEENSNEVNLLRYNDSITVSSAKERSKRQSAIIAKYTAKLELSHSTLTQEYHEAKAAEHAAIAAEQRAKVEELDNKLAAMRNTAAINEDIVFFQSSKRRRT
eukprot:scaffold23705_cov74-Skeletonema_menzelii.AAC.1